MAKNLHSAKLEQERNVFLAELAASLPVLTSLNGGGSDSRRARILHSTFLPIYILKRHKPVDLKTKYAEILFTYAIEAECLLILGFKNAARTMLRGWLEAAIKFVYYEYHPIENIAHHDGEQARIHGIEYREFIYMFPGLKDISFFARDTFERLWADLCKSVHVNLRCVEKLSIVADLESALNLPEPDFQMLLNLLKTLQKVIIALLFSVRNDWASQMEKALFETLFAEFTPEERNQTHTLLRIE